MYFDILKCLSVTHECDGQTDRQTRTTTSEPQHHTDEVYACLRYCSSQVCGTHDLDLDQGWWSGVVVGALASINEGNLRPARLVLRWAIVPGCNFLCRTFISVCNH